MYKSRISLLTMTMAAGLAVGASGCGSKQDVGADCCVSADARPLAASSETIDGVVKAADLIQPESVGGNFSRRPIYSFVVRETQAVAIELTSPQDTILLIGGETHPLFNDDANGLNPAIYTELEPGVYHIYVGVWGVEGDLNYSLNISPMTAEELAFVRESAFTGHGYEEAHVELSSDPLNLSADPVLGPLTVTAAVQSGTVTFSPSSDLASIAPPNAACYGAVDPTRPALVFSRGAGEPNQRIEVTAQSEEHDLLIAVVDEEGNYYCNDDYRGLDPGVLLEGNSASYRVFLAAFSASENLNATVSVRALTVAPLVTERVELRAGDGRRTINLKGDFSVPNTFGTSCSGNLASTDTPLAAVNVRGSHSSVEFIARSTQDAVLTVVAPDGTTHCNDDTYGLDAALTFTAPREGEYKIFAGNYRPTNEGALSLEIVQGPSLTTNSRTRTVSVARGESVEASVRAGGSNAGQDVSPACVGFFDMSAPSAVVNFPGPSTTVRWDVDSSADTVLMLRDSEGAITCVDDGNGMNPSAVLPTRGGTTHVWLGTFQRQDRPADAKIRVGLEN